MNLSNFFAEVKRRNIYKVAVALLEVPAGITTADLRLNPVWDPLRKDPRFQKFCEERNK